MRAQTRVVSRCLLRWLRAAGVVLPMVGAGFAVAQEPQPPAPVEEAGKVVTRTASGGYTIDAYETNIAQVLTEVGEQAGFTVQAPDNFNSPLTMSAEDLPLDQLLRRVLRNENYIIVYRGGVQKTAISGDDIDKIFLLSQASSGPAPRAAAGTSPLAGPGAKPPPRTAAAAVAEGAAPGGNTFAADLAARAARAREQAAARRAAAGDAMPPPPPGPAPVPPDAAAAADAPAHMVETPEDFTPPPDAPQAPDATEEHLAGDVPPDAAVDGGQEFVEPDPDEY